MHGRPFNWASTVEEMDPASGHPFPIGVMDGPWSRHLQHVIR